MQRSIFLILISTMFFGTVTSAMSLRIHTPVQTSASSDDGSSFSSTGLSVRAILGMVGVGYTTSTLSVKPSSGSASDYGSQALDLSLTPPILSMFTVGIGTVIGGSVPKSQNLDKASGSTTFFNFNLAATQLLTQIVCKCLPRVQRFAASQDTSSFMISAIWTSQ